MNTLWSAQCKVTLQVSSSRLILTTLDRDKGVLPALNGFAVLVITTDVSEEMDRLTADLCWALSAALDVNWKGRRSLTLSHDPYYIFHFNLVISRLSVIFCSHPSEFHSYFLPMSHNILFPLFSSLLFSSLLFSSLLFSSQWKNQSQ